MVTEINLHSREDAWNMSPQEVLWNYEVLMEKEHREYVRIADAVAVHKQDEAGLKKWRLDNED